MKRATMKIQSFACGVALLGAAAFILNVSRAQAAQSYSSPATPASFAELADKVKESVVNISTTQVVEGNPLLPFLGPNSPFGNFLGPNLPKEFFGNNPHGKMKTHALGSGFAISEEGLILTNNHDLDKRRLHDLENDIDVVNHQIHHDADVRPSQGIGAGPSADDERRRRDLLPQRVQYRIEAFQIPDLKQPVA